MKTCSTETRFVFAKRSYCNACAASVAIMLSGVLFTAGCGSKNESTPPPATAQTASEGNTAAPTGSAAASTAPQETVKGTPEQEAAKQRAIDEGAAIQAANNPTQGGK